MMSCLGRLVARPGRRGWLALLLAAAAALGLVVVVVLRGAGSSATPAAGAPLMATPVAVETPAAALPPVRTQVKSGDTVESVVRRLSGDDWIAWRDALVGQLDPRRLVPGTSFEGVRAADGSLQRLRVALNQRTELHLERTGAAIEVQRIERPVDSIVERIEGEVHSSLFAAVEKAGGEPELAVALANVFQWDVDFLRDVRKGDRFVAVVDRRSIDGSFYEYGTLYAARFVNDGKAVDAIAYPDGDGHVGFFDLQGRPLRKQFLRSPLEFSRITSRFSHSRFHPILQRRMPHYGVDYGAPVGTPVLVTADGRVTFAGQREGAGRMVTVSHANGYETNYLHLSRYGQGIRAGVRVSQGQVIGHVGSSGLSTGPHLDYRVRLNGQWVNPLSISSPPAQPLPAERLQRFLSHALAVMLLLDGSEPPTGAQC
jgi:murein DD-endopeptidase MepM/ murein hydrolase activator NlpD